MQLILAAVLALFLASCNAQKEIQCDLGKEVIVQFHGWRYDDIQAECDAASAAYYCAFQVPSPHEHQVFYQGNISFPENAQYPWWQRYNVVSFRMQGTDSGSLLEFQEMLRTCNANNIRIIVDVEMNNAGDESTGFGSSGTYYDGDQANLQYGHFSGRRFFHLPNGQVPDGCPTSSGSIVNETNPDEIRHCQRFAVPRNSSMGPFPLNDLKTSLDDTREGYITPINDLLSGMGDAARSVYGIRFAHARWVDPVDLRYIVNSVDDITGFPGTKPFIVSEVLPDNIIGESEYFDFGQVEESRAGPLLSDILKKRNPNYIIANLTLWGPDMGLMNPWDAVVYIDDPASQRGWPELNDLDKTLSFREETLYQVANAFMLAHPYGLPRIHSSYSWNRIAGPDNKYDINDWVGPPRTDGVVDNVVINSTGDGCTGSWNCEHRWNSILGMARFRNGLNIFDHELVTNYWTNGRYQIAFSRGDGTTNRGFFAMNLEDGQDLTANVYSGMAPGEYCNLATGPTTIIGNCANRVTVNSDGRVAVNIPAGDSLPFLAIVQAQ